MVKSMLVLGGTVLSVLASTVEASYISYSTVAGYFQQDNSSTVASTFNYVWYFPLHIGQKTNEILDRVKLWSDQPSV